MRIGYDAYSNNFELTVRGEGKYTMKMGADPSGNITRINNVLEGFSGNLDDSKRKLATLEKQLQTAQEEVAKPFPQEQELIQKQARLSELNALLNMDERGSEAALIDDEAAVEADVPETRSATTLQEEEPLDVSDAPDEREAEEDEPDEPEQTASKPKRYQMAI